MATTATKAPAKRTAPAPQAAASSTAAAVQTPKGNAKAKAQAPQAPLYTVGTLPPVRPGTHRAYAQQVARALAKAHPKGFTLAQYRAALEGQCAASNIAPPKGGWAGHNMPTWAANPAQAWLVPVATAK